MPISWTPRAPPIDWACVVGFPEPEQLALERLLLDNPHLADATVRRELGPVLADERFGEELIETLQAYFDAGENVTAAARRLHLATRTVGYRLEKIESLLGHPLDGQNATAPLDRTDGAPPALTSVDHPGTLDPAPARRRLAAARRVVGDGLTGAVAEWDVETPRV